MKRVTILVLAMLPLGALADSPMPVTSDTADYCLGLARRLDASHAMPPAVRVIWQEGRDMCQGGHVRGGLARLRRALMILRGEAE